MISKNQLEYLIRTCNYSSKTLAPLELANIGEAKADVYVDTTKFAELINIKKQFGYCTVEPGITLAEVNRALQKEGRSIALEYPRLLKNPSVEYVIQENQLCLQTLKHGFFNDQNRVRRLGLVKGSGELIQTGGNRVSD